MKRIVCILHTTDYRGDHSADAAIVHEIADGETVDALALRLLESGNRYAAEGSEWLEIKLSVKAP